VSLEYVKKNANHIRITLKFVVSVLELPKSAKIFDIFDTIFCEQYLHVLGFENLLMG